MKTKEEVWNKNVPGWMLSMSEKGYKSALNAMEEYHQQFNQWTTEKPTEPCLFVTAILRGKQWFYEIFELSNQKDDDGEYILLDHEGNSEYFNINDLKADKYLILPKHE